ncbi:hypothetical protein Dsin_015952 [Dipteronia sinensis]|uniref:Uncharacterized protein n=1 Tax=Dipteronia sinensis TaxID=43782 RepID=A0AAE0ACS6_9ROSI|nr:hypothetical protein Dsin_015952 [Dipteronia sinensis]
MGWSQSELLCKKHQSQNKNPQGVCSICLGERLSQLSAIPQKKTSMVAPSSSSSISSSPVSCSSSSTARPRHNRNGSEMMGSISFMLSAGNYGLKKSRSMAFVPKNFVGEHNNIGKKKRGFWSKLLHLEGKKVISTHSKTVSVSER